MSNKARCLILLCCSRMLVEVIGRRECAEDDAPTRGVIWNEDFYFEDKLIVCVVPKNEDDFVAEVEVKVGDSEVVTIYLDKKNHLPSLHVTVGTLNLTNGAPYQSLYGHACVPFKFLLDPFAPRVKARLQKVISTGGTLTVPRDRLVITTKSQKNVEFRVCVDPCSDPSDKACVKATTIPPSGDAEQEEKTTGFQWYWILIICVVAILIIFAVIVLCLRKRRTPAREAKWMPEAESRKDQNNKCDLDDDGYLRIRASKLEPHDRRLHVDSKPHDVDAKKPTYGTAHSSPLTDQEIATGDSEYHLYEQLDPEVSNTPVGQNSQEENERGDAEHGGNPIENTNL